MIVRAQLPVAPDPAIGVSPWWDSTAVSIAVAGVIVLMALVIVLWNVPPKHKAEIIRALGDALRPFRRGGPPGAP